ncbi:hypothetical protein QR685DRAFT_600825 [Neurospora intermedia]|uniref:Uncharacterized protein n=1 Tax=Neurospora intermedia TaxID=5142 RepID=A0ABR3D2J5_NEUIN
MGSQKPLSLPIAPVVWLIGQSIRQWEKKHVTASVTSRGRNEDEPPFRYWLVAPFASHSSIPSFPSLSSNHHPRTLHQSPVFCPSSSVSPYLSPGSRRLSRCTAELAICRPLLSCPCVAPIFSDPILRFPQCPSGLNRCGIRRKTCVHGLHRTRCEMLAIMMVTRMVKISHACCKHLDMNEQPGHMRTCFRLDGLLSPFRSQKSVDVHCTEKFTCTWSLYYISDPNSPTYPWKLEPPE